MKSVHCLWSHATLPRRRCAEETVWWPVRRVLSGAKSLSSLPPPRPSGHSWTWRPHRRVAVRPVAITLSESPTQKRCRSRCRTRLSWDGKLNTLTISTPLTEDEAEVLGVNLVTSPTAAVADCGRPKSAAPRRLISFRDPPNWVKRFPGAQRSGDAGRVFGARLMIRRCWRYPWDLTLRYGKHRRPID